MPVIEKSPSEPWPEPFPGLEIRLLPGTHQPAVFDGVPDLAILGAEGAIIRGGANVSGEPDCSLRFHNGAHRLRIIGPLEVCYSDGRGVRITNAESIVLRDIFSHHHGIEGVITGNCRNGVYENIRVEDSRDSPDSNIRRQYPPDKRHGVYISGNADGSHVQGLTVLRVTGSGLQANGAGMDAVINSLFASEMVFHRCGSGGTPSLSLMACRDCTFEQFLIERLGNTNNRWAVLFSDGHGADFACYDNTFREYTVPPGTHYSEEDGSSRNSFVAAPGWSPAAPPAPEEEWKDCPGCVGHVPAYPAGQVPADSEPETPGEPPPPEDNAELNQALEDMGAALAAMEEALTEAQDALKRAQEAAGTA